MAKERLSMSKMAKELGISQPSLSRLVSSGMFEGTYFIDGKRYRFDVEKAKEAYSSRVSITNQAGGFAAKEALSEEEVMIPCAIGEKRGSCLRRLSLQGHN